MSFFFENLTKFKSKMQKTFGCVQKNSPTELGLFCTTTKLSPIRAKTHRNPAKKNYCDISIITIYLNCKTRAHVFFVPAVHVSRYMYSDQDCTDKSVKVNNQSNVYFTNLDC